MDLEKCRAFRSTGHPRVRARLARRRYRLGPWALRLPGRRWPRLGLAGAARRRSKTQHESLPCAGAGDGERGFRQQPSDHAEPHRSAREQRRAGERIPADAHDRGRADQLAQLRDARGRLTGRRSGGLDRLHVRQARDFPGESSSLKREASRAGVDLHVKLGPLVGVQRFVRLTPRGAAAPASCASSQLQHVLVARRTPWRFPPAALTARRTTS